MTNIPSAFHGMKIFVTPDRPKMQLSPECPVTPDFREEINQWMLEFFGTVNDTKDGEALSSQMLGMIWMNPRTYADFKTAMAARNPQ